MLQPMDQIKIAKMKKSKKALSEYCVNLNSKKQKMAE